MGPALLLLLPPLLPEEGSSVEEPPEGDGEEESEGVGGEEASLLSVALKFWLAKTDSSWLFVKPDSGFLPLFLRLLVSDLFSYYNFAMSALF